MSNESTHSERGCTLAIEYVELAERYLNEFVHHTGIEDDAPFWVGNEVGGVACVGDYFIDYQTIRIVVDKHLTFETFDEWYNYCTKVGILDSCLSTPTLQQWLDNEFVRIPDERLEKMKRMKERFEKLLHESEKNESHVENGLKPLAPDEEWRFNGGSC